MPANGARIVQLSTACWASAIRDSEPATWALARSILASRAVGVGAGVVQLLLRLHAGLLQLLGAFQFDLGVAELNLEVGNGGFGGVAVGLGGIQGFLHVGVVEGGEKLTLLDAGAFVEENAGDPAGNFGRNGGPAARRDVARGVEQSLAAAGASGFVDRGDFDDRLLLPESVGSGGNAAQDHQKAKKDGQALADFAAFALALVNAQRGEIVFGRSLVAWPLTWFLR